MDCINDLLCHLVSRYIQIIEAEAEIGGREDSERGHSLPLLPYCQADWPLTNTRGHSSCQQPFPYTDLFDSISAPSPFLPRPRVVVFPTVSNPGILKYIVLLNCNKKFTVSLNLSSDFPEDWIVFWSDSDTYRIYMKPHGVFHVAYWPFIIDIPVSIYILCNFFQCKPYSFSLSSDDFLVTLLCF